MKSLKCISCNDKLSPYDPFPYCYMCFKVTCVECKKTFVSTNVNHLCDTCQKQRSCDICNAPGHAIYKGGWKCIYHFE